MMYVCGLKQKAGVGALTAAPMFGRAAWASAPRLCVSAHLALRAPRGGWQWALHLIGQDREDESLAHSYQLGSGRTGVQTQTVWLPRHHTVQTIPISTDLSTIVDVEFKKWK